PDRRRPLPLARRAGEARGEQRHLRGVRPGTRGRDPATGGDVAAGDGGRAEVLRVENGGWRGVEGDSVLHPPPSLLRVLLPPLPPRSPSRCRVTARAPAASPA